MHRQLTGWLALVMALVLLSWVVWDIYQRHYLSAPPSNLIVHTYTSELSTGHNDLNAIINAHLFGQQHKKQKSPVIKAAPTSLKLKLVGIFQAITAAQSLALIESDDRKQHVVAPGEQIGQSNVILAAVEKDHVLLQRDGNLEKLAMQRKMLGKLSKLSIEKSIFEPTLR